MSSDTANFTVTLVIKTQRRECHTSHDQFATILPARAANPGPRCPLRPPPHCQYPSLSLSRVFFLPFGKCAPRHGWDELCLSVTVGVAGGHEEVAARSRCNYERIFFVTKIQRDVHPQLQVRHSCRPSCLVNHPQAASYPRLVPASKFPIHAVQDQSWRPFQHRRRGNCSTPFRAFL